MAAAAHLAALEDLTRDYAFALDLLLDTGADDPETARQALADVLGLLDALRYHAGRASASLERLAQLTPILTPMAGRARR